ncbi:aldo/keto reductase [Halobacillus kuroshimensis]|uniref:Aldo/keto reductase n=1 Tax=Halobacillus kuroshimensis TaxID=302481 RepID=A0ABS3DRS5_9BACI|nr:aldo/keto reductase [Halobacillus kuroshimensis]MBN8233948.1 aldo/keto reductase [Halobacillus kuroshimensis]
MKKVKLGRSEVEATRIALGTWAIGGTGWGGTNEDESIQTIQAALSKGITTIDTAPAYGKGLAEELVGKAIACSHVPRDELVLAAKGGVDWTRESSWRDSRPDQLEQELENSMKRLQTDYLDIYQVHWPDPDFPIKETAEKMRSFYESGHIRAIGVCNFSPEQMDEWQNYAPIHTAQMHLNLLQRYLIDWFEYSHNHEIATLSWGSLAHGMLTGKFDKNASFPQSDLRSHIELFQGGRFPQLIEAVESLEEFASKRGHSLISLAVRWLLDHKPGADVALWGARKPSHLERVEEVDDFQLSREELLMIDEMLYSHTHDLRNGSLKEYGPPVRSEI